MNADRPLTNTAWADREITFSHREIRTDNTTGVAGVTRRENGTYRVRLGSKRLGTFKTFEAAAAARKQAEQDVTAGHEIACSRRSPGRTGVTGVFLTRHGRYAAQGGGKYLGVFATLETAAAARQQAEQQREVQS